MQNYRDQLAQAVKEARLAKGWNARELASAMGAHQTSVARVEQALHVPNALTLDRLERVLGVILPKPPRRSSRPPKGDTTTIYKIRVVLSGGIIHLASHSKPTVATYANGSPIMDADLIEDSLFADTLAYIKWENVTAISWRPATIQAEVPALPAPD